MPHNSHSSQSRHGAGGSSSDDLGSTDEVKVFKDEGDREEEKISSENLLEEKSSLIDLTESEEKGSKLPARPELDPVFSKIEPHAPGFNMGYLVSHYSYANGAAAGLPVTMASKMGLPPFFCHSGDHLTTPPPAHCGIPPYQLDPKTMALTRPTLYTFPSTQYAYPMLGPDMAPSWHTPSVYSAASSFRNPYTSSLPISTTLSSDFPFRFSPNLLPTVHTSPHHVLNPHATMVTSAGPSKQDCHQEPSTSHARFARNMDSKMGGANSKGNECKDIVNDKKKPHIKKPLNAFMLYMREMRAKVVAECTLKESAAINQILGRRWHELSREEQSKYYEKARQERQLHMELYPGWSARDNYGYVSKKKKRKKDRSPADSGGNNLKKCRARFGLDQQNQWCKPCRRKKKCIRYMEAMSGGGSASSSGTKEDLYQESDDLDDHGSEDDNIGSPGSFDDNNKTADDDTESLNRSLSSPGGLSALSSLRSPSTSLASPLNLLTSPALPATVGLPSFGLNELQHHQEALSQQQQQWAHQQQSSHKSQHLSRPSNAVETSTQLIGMQQQHQTHQQQHLNQHTQHFNPHMHPAVTLANSNIFQHGKASNPFPYNNDGGRCIDPTNTSSSEAAVVSAAAAAFTESTMLSLLNPSPSIPSNLAPPSSSGSIATTTQMLTNSSSIATTCNSNASTISTDIITSTSNITTPNSTPNGCDSYGNNTHATVSNIKTLSSGNTEINTASTKYALSASGAKTPVENFEKSLTTPTHRNPIGANPHDINNPLSINQLTKCGENTNSSSSSNINRHNQTQNIMDTNSLNALAQQYKNINQQQKHHHQLTAPILLPQAGIQQYQQQQQHQNALTRHHHHPHAHSPLFHQHFQQFSHHLASVAAAAGVHLPNILNAAAVVGTNNPLRTSESNDTKEEKLSKAACSEALLATTTITTTSTTTTTAITTTSSTEAAGGSGGTTTTGSGNNLVMATVAMAAAAETIPTSKSESSSNIRNNKSGTTNGESDASSVTVTR
ncbi:protein pangolin, isoforms A/H/I/S [Eurosta solidaginis]|uniref:protein pangolin, isoforms A/H/I/S n=1 Tax=Eurosta solidaginis TaxID=178769 RepID=UPI0035316CB1